jgi:endonuclease YncB( thermonuclease family)
MSAVFLEPGEVAEITLPDGRNLSDALLEAGLAKPYDGGKKQ